MAAIIDVDWLPRGGDAWLDETAPLDASPTHASTRLRTLQPAYARFNPIDPCRFRIAGALTISNSTLATIVHQTPGGGRGPWVSESCRRHLSPPSMLRAVRTFDAPRTTRVRSAPDAAAPRRGSRAAR